MFEFKLQLGCFFAAIVYLYVYLRDSRGRGSKVSMRCHPLFDWIIGICPWAIIFDGATAWTVNHMDIVPGWLNLTLHGLFFISEDVIIILVFAYMLELTMGKQSPKRWLVFITPGIITLIVTVLNLKDLYYIKGERTYYSMGISVIASYTGLAFYWFLLGLMLLKHYRIIEKHKRVNLLFYIIFCYSMLLVQCLLPESLVTSLLPIASLFCIYENFENINLRKIHNYNAEMVTGFATLVESRDDSTGGHIKRTRDYVSIILDEMKQDPYYRTILTRDYVRNIKNAAPMHDIGKISTPDEILQKPGKLTDEEFAIMKEHAAVGGDIIKKTFENIDDPEYLNIAYEVARYHHEKWNGKGYPEGLSGEEIPLHARVMAIADVFDAVSADRCYREAMPLEACFKIIEEGAGTQFDPRLARLFLNAKAKIIRCKSENE